MPENSHVGVSQRIESEEERARLKALVEPFCDELGGLSSVPLQRAPPKKNYTMMRNFKRLWRSPRTSHKYPTRSIRYGELALTQRILRILSVPA